MPQSNIIVNGSFDGGNAGWTGTDLETNYTETAYLGNGSGNHVSELDGNAGPVTVMEQTVTIDAAQTTELTFRTALRTASNGNAGTDGFRVDILDADGNVIATQTVMPTSNAWTDVSIPVTFDSPGAYTVRFTELGPNDSLGAIIDDVSMLVCFVAGTLIDTDLGPRPVEELQPGDRVWTLDAGFQPVRWIGTRTVTMAEQYADPSLRPVVFSPDALGGGLPSRQLAVSPQHRLCLEGWLAEVHFGDPSVLVPAHALVDGGKIRSAAPEADVTYVHFLLDGHQIVRSDGVLTESFFPSALSLSGLDRVARAEVLALFPDLATLTHAFPRTVRPVVKGREAGVLRGMLKKAA